jgi:hypothetical protein
MAILILCSVLCMEMYTYCIVLFCSASAVDRKFGYMVIYISDHINELSYNMKRC